MASFTDQLVAFNPYIQQIPVDDYVRVGLIKQREYESGVQKVQGYIDSIAGLEVVKPEQKDYLQQRINNLQNEVGKIVQRDFSRQEVVNSVGELTSKIASDPIIHTAVASTQSYKKGLSAISQAREKGKSSVSNEWDFHDQFQKWYNDKDVSTRFTGSFTPYTDVTKKISDIIKTLEPNSHIEDNPFKRGLNGEILLDKDGLPQIDFAMIEKGSKSLTPERIRAAISANITPDDLNQLGIDGRFSYRTQDAEGMKNITDQSYNYRLDQINDVIEGLLIERQTVNNDPAKAEVIDSQIQAYKDRADQYQQQYKQDIARINQNLEGYKSSLYSKNWISKFGDGYAYAQNSLTYKQNPYFVAAERRRENDIRFNEFMLDKQIQVARLGLEEARLGLEERRVAAYEKYMQSRIKKGIKEGALEGIPLSDAIFEPIDQEQLEDVTVDNFLKETNAIDEDIENQKMAILAQQTDLVTVRRDKDGKNARYEYNVKGKDPNEVKTQADAVIGRLKSAYDADPQSVDDGVRTYFNNLANADQVVQNRKFVVGNLNKQADEDVGSIDDLTRNFKPLTVHSASGTTYTFTPKQIVEYNDKISKALKSSSSGGTGGAGTPYYDEEIINSLSPGERFLFEVERKVYQGRGNNVEKGIRDKIWNIKKNINFPNEKLIGERKGYLNNAVKDVVNTQQQTSFTLEAFEAPDRKRAQAVATRIVNTIVGAGKEGTGGRYNLGDLKDMLGDKSTNTTYSLVSKGRGKYALGVSNTEVTARPIEIEITRNQAEELFGQNQFLDDFYNIRESLQLSKGTGKWTTDVRRLGQESAFNLQNGLLNNYSVKYHVEDPLKNGGLQVRLYIYDKANKRWLPERTAKFGQLLNEAQVTKFLSTIGDQYINSVIGTESLNQ